MPAARATPPSHAVPPLPGFSIPTRTLTPADGLERLLATEWLLTNGLGGFAMGTAAGVPARRYHGLLVGATRPPVGRIMALNAMVETLNVEGRSIDLSMFRFGEGGRTLHPRGDAYLVRFEHDLSARWTWEIPAGEGRALITKEVYVHQGVNAMCVRYTLSQTGSPATTMRLRVRPLLSMRDFHALNRRGTDRFGIEPGPDTRQCRVRCDDRTLALAGAPFTYEPQWWYDFHYAFDAARGQDSLEDLWSPGYFAIDPAPGGAGSIAATITASLADNALPAPDADRSARLVRLRSLYEHTARPAPALADADRSALASLVAAADQFVVSGTTALRAGSEVSRTSTIAGYPWFSDWGRDTFTALPGLLHATGRFDDARETLLAFARHRRNGIIPNVFNDRTGEPEFNTVDASLWFIHAACRWLEPSGDRDRFARDLAPACLDIVSAYRRGTDFNIAMDPLDKLITAGAPGTQLTWMDAKREGVVFTPRHGKAVEINALWYNALRSLADALRPSDATGAANLADLAEAAGRSFRVAFWNERDRCLFDCLAPGESGGRAVWVPVADIRPNQIFAVSLPHSPLSDEQRQAVLACIRSRLYTPMGLRTLDPADPRYQPRFEGNLFERDRAYHNGTAWPWLLGPYAEAILRVGGFSPRAKREARAAIDPILKELSAPRAGFFGASACLGQIAEIYDGSDPQRPQGCTAQAWSIAEVLRAFLLTAV